MKNVVITGVGTGIGKALCIHFLAKGYSVIGVLRNQNHYSSLVRDSNSLKGVLKIVYSDLENENFTDEVLKQLQNLNIGSISILINVAGVLDITEYDELNVAQMNKVMMVNFISPAILTSKLVPLLKGSEGANVINITSMSGFQGSVRFPGLSVYGASKAALGSYSESIACELAPLNIHINALAIGSVNTKMLKKAFPDFEASVSAEDMAEYIFSFATMGYKFHNGKTISVAITNP